MYLYGFISAFFSQSVRPSHFKSLLGKKKRNMQVNSHIPLHALFMCKKLSIFFYFPSQCACSQHGSIGIFQLRNQQCSFNCVYFQDILIDFFLNLLHDIVA